MEEATDTKAPVRLVPVIVLAWLVAAVVLVAMRWPTVSTEGPMDADSIMRLVQVRDLLDGQSWFDTVQQRLGPPGGTQLHWSRLIDAPVAGLILLLKHVAPSRWIAEMAAATAWPVMLLLALMAATAWVATALGDRVTATLAGVLAIQSGPGFVHYLPGAIDHHNAQIVLTLVYMGCILRAERSRLAMAGAGLAAGLMLAIGMESLPVIVAGTVILTLAWLFEPARFAGAAASYGLSFATTAVASLAATVPAAYWLAGACDMLSATYVAPAAIGGFGLAVFAFLMTPAQPLGHRFLALLGVAVICIAVVAGAFPACLAGPLGAIDPRTQAIWYSRIPETRSLIALFSTQFPTAVSTLAVPLIGFAASLWYLSTSDEDARFRWAAVALLSGTALFSMMLQNRAAAAAGALAVPIVACLVVRIARWGRGEEARLSIPVLIVLLPFVSFAAWHVLATTVLQPLAPRFGLAAGDPPVAVAPDCLAKTAFRELAAQKPATILAQTGLGPAILAYTPHKAVAGNYHRGADAIVDTYAAFSSSGEEPPGVIARRGVDLIVVCHKGGDGEVGDEALVRGLIGRLKRGEVPDWLDPVFAGDRLLAYRVKAE